MRSKETAKNQRQTDALVAAGNMRFRETDMMKQHDSFYDSPEWRQLRRKVLIEDRHECQKHKERGYYARANTVHHVKYRDKHPDLALSKYYIDADGKQKRQLISLCHDCHEEEHGHRAKNPGEPLTPERW
jgi:5-methylcytosine-specific restriction protein A